MNVFNSDLDPIYQGTAHTAGTGYAVDDRIVVFADPKTQFVKSHNLTDDSWFDGGVDLAYFHSEDLSSDAEHGEKYRVINDIPDFASAGDYVLHMPAPTADDSYYLNVTPASEHHHVRVAEADIDRLDLTRPNDGDSIPTAVLTSTLLHACARGMANAHALFTQPQPLAKHFEVNGAAHIHSFSVSANTVFTPFTGNVQDFSDANLIGAVLSLSTDAPTEDGDTVQQSAHAHLLNDGQMPSATSGIPVYGRVTLGAMDTPPVGSYDLNEVRLHANSDTDVVVEYFTYADYQEQPDNCPAILAGDDDGTVVPPIDDTDNNDIIWFNDPNDQVDDFQYRYIGSDWVTSTDANGNTQLDSSTFRVNKNDYGIAITEKFNSNNNGVSSFVDATHIYFEDAYFDTTNTHSFDVLLHIPSSGGTNASPALNLARLNLVNTTSEGVKRNQNEGGIEFAESGDTVKGTRGMQPTGASTEPNVTPTSAMHGLVKIRFIKDPASNNIQRMDIYSIDDNADNWFATYAQTAQIATVTPPVNGSVDGTTNELLVAFGMSGMQGLTLVGIQRVPV